MNEKQEAGSDEWDKKVVSIEFTVRHFNCKIMKLQSYSRLL